MKRKFLSVGVILFFVMVLGFHFAIAQNTQPFWSLAGNSNTNAASILGTTNALPVRIVTNGTERISVTSAGNVGIGTTNPVSILTVKNSGGSPAGSWITVGSPIFAGFTENINTQVHLATAGSAASHRPVFQGKRSRGTLAAPTAVVNNDFLTSFLSSGYDGTEFQNPATIDFFVDGAPSAGNVPARISFVTGSNIGNRQERLKVGSTGNFNFNNDQLFINAALARVGIGTVTPSVKFQVVGGTDAGPGGGGFIVTGLETGANIAIDNNEIMARSNGGVSTLFLNHNGGDVLINDLNGIGNMGIGTPNPANKLHIKQAIANRAIEWEHESTADFWTVGIGTSTHNCRFEFNGTGKGQISSVDGAYTPISDISLKQDIELIPGLMDKVMKLKASQYFFKDTRQIAKHKSVGFIAQEVEKVFPELVYDIDGGYKGINYSAFAVVAIKALQEQQGDILAKNQQINDLRNEVDQLKDLLIKKGIITPNEINTTSNVLSKARLDQSIPNPSGGTTSLGYFLPNDAKKASILISDIKGAVLKSYPISQTGSGKLSINSKDFGAGVYIYTLIIDGNKLDSKKMVLMN